MFSLQIGLNFAHFKPARQFLRRTTRDFESEPDREASLNLLKLQGFSVSVRLAF